MFKHYIKIESTNWTKLYLFKIQEWLKGQLERWKDQRARRANSRDYGHCGTEEEMEQMANWSESNGFDTPGGRRYRVFLEDLRNRRAAQREQNSQEVPSSNFGDVPPAYSERDDPPTYSEDDID